MVPIGYVARGQSSGFILYLSPPQRFPPRRLRLHGQTVIFSDVSPRRGLFEPIHHVREERKNIALAQRQDLLDMRSFSVFGIWQPITSVRHSKVEQKKIHEHLINSRSDRR